MKIPGVGFPQQAGIGRRAENVGGGGERHRLNLYIISKPPPKPHSKHSHRNLSRMFFFHFISKLKFLFSYMYVLFF